MDPAVRIGRMDEAGIDFQVVSPNPLTYFHHIPTDAAVYFCRRHNDAIATMLSEGDNSTRLAGLAALPMQSPDAAARELERAVQELGLLGGAVGTDFGNGLDAAAGEGGRVALDAPELDAFYSCCTGLDVPRILHLTPAGIDGPKGVRRIDTEGID